MQQLLLTERNPHALNFPYKKIPDGRQIQMSAAVDKKSERRY